MNVSMIVEPTDMKNQPPKLVNIVILVVDVVMELHHLTVHAVMKEHTFMMEFVETVQQHIMEMIPIGHVNHVTEPVAIVTDLNPLIAQIVAMKPPDFT